MATSYHSGYLIEILRTMYRQNEITLSQIQKLLSDKKITSDEYTRIINKEGGGA
jgi:hypothetical protein